MKDKWITFWTSEDVCSTLEIQYNPKLEKFKEIKSFEDQELGTTERVLGFGIQLTEAQEDAFNKTFPEVEI